MMLTNLGRIDMSDEIKFPITERLVDSIDFLPCEIEYKDATGKIVGYWAYGYWEPDLPYQGQAENAPIKDKEPA